MGIKWETKIYLYCVKQSIHEIGRTERSRAVQLGEALSVRGKVGHYIMTCSAPRFAACSLANFAPSRSALPI